MANTVKNGLAFRESENANSNARFTVAFGLCHNLCVHMWKTQLKIQFATPFENCPEYEVSVNVKLILHNHMMFT